jgi:hypothetical protein
MPSLTAAAVSRHSQQSFWLLPRLVSQREVRCIKQVSCCRYKFLGSARFWFGAQRGGNVAAVADLVIICKENYIQLSLELGRDLLWPGLQVSPLLR